MDINLQMRTLFRNLLFDISLHYPVDFEDLNQRYLSEKRIAPEQARPPRPSMSDEERPPAATHADNLNEQRPKTVFTNNATTQKQLDQFFNKK